VHALTAEQQSVVEHPSGAHARVLAVAGSGKTTTMVHRVLHLLANGMTRTAVQVVMFNVLARKQFAAKLDEAGCATREQPAIDTFHSCAFRIIKRAIDAGIYAEPKEQWIEDDTEQARILVNRVVKTLEREGVIQPNTIDIEVALAAIGLWKGELVPADRAHAACSGDGALVDVYLRFEQEREQRQAIGFDDFVPIAVQLLQMHPTFRAQSFGHLRHVIVDEYQDINTGQQTLVELLAAQHADIMVVGDDDQTIYEWRGARPDFILRYMTGTVLGKTVLDYTLSHSFRFGPLLAQTAMNVIVNNAVRVAKPLTAHNVHQTTDVFVVREQAEQSTESDQMLCQQLMSLVQRTGEPQHVVVLGRTFSQLQGLEAACLQRKIPYRVLGRRPFFERREVSALIDYLQLAEAWQTPVDGETTSLVLSIVNMPNRFISADTIKAALREGKNQQRTVAEVFHALTDPNRSALTRVARDRLRDLADVLIRLNELWKQTQPVQVALNVILTGTNYTNHFTNYYGNGSESSDRISCVMQFVEYAKGSGLTVGDFVTHFMGLNHTFGYPEEQQILFTTVYRTKGLEYDYVFIPRAQEGYMPVLLSDSLQVWDKTRMSAPPTKNADSIETERRLFYVAMTRARRALYIGVSAPPPSGDVHHSKPVETSRFLLEMRLEPTIAVMRHLPAASSGGTLLHLLESLKEHGASDVLLQQLLRYFPERPGVARMIGNERIPRWSAITKPTTTAPFRRKSKPPALPWWSTVDAALDNEPESES
jgi:DNA helicase-2/ATP-dependent DNA helicase PcrA